jgi:hypothetical protein
MFAVETYAAVRRFVFVEGKSRREAARVFGLSRDTISKICRYSAPPGYVRSKQPERPKLGPLVPVIDAILEADKTAPPKQRHTAKRIFERLRIKHGYAGGYTVVKDYVRIARARSREVFVPLAHPPGHAQVDFGECVGVIGGVRMKLHVFCFDLPQSDACFVKAYPAETTDAFLDGHVSAFAFFGGVPISMTSGTWNSSASMSKGSWSTQIRLRSPCAAPKQDRTNPEATNPTKLTIPFTLKRPPMKVIAHAPAEHGTIDPRTQDTLLQAIEALYVAVREAARREASPTAAIIDSQTAKAAAQGDGPRAIWRVSPDAASAKSALAAKAGSPRVDLRRGLWYGHFCYLPRRECISATERQCLSA